MIKHRVEAFTILEITITMLITALLIGITYTSYEIVIKSYLSFNKKNEGVSVLLNLDYVLKRDFERAKTIYNDTSGISLLMSDHLINYEIKPDFVARHSFKIDTFKVQTKNLNVFFESIPLHETQTADEQNRIDELEFIVIDKDNEFPYHYIKSYSSTDLINRLPNADH